MTLNMNGVTCMDPELIRVEAVPQEVRRRVIPWRNVHKDAYPTYRVSNTNCGGAAST